MVAAAMIGSAVVGGITSSMAASKQAKAAKQAAALQANAGKQVRADLAPYRNVGKASLYEMTALMGLPVNFPGSRSGQGNVGSSGGNQINQALQQAASLGHNGDTEIAHVTPGETVVPASVASNLPGGHNALWRAYRDQGMDPRKYVVDSPVAQVNPDTGAQMFADDSNYGGDNYGGDNMSGGDSGGGGDGFDANGNDTFGADPGYSGSVGGVDDFGQYDGSSYDDFSFNNTRTGMNYGGVWGGAAGLAKDAYDYASQFDGVQGSSDPNDYADGGDGGWYGYGGGSGSGGMYASPNGTNPNGAALPADYYSQENALARFRTSPDYQFRFQQGLDALDRSAAARGSLLSGRQLKAVNEYGQNLASGEYGTYYNRLAGLAGAGQSSAAQTGDANLKTAANAGSYWQAAGNAQAQGIQGIGNAIQSGIGGVATYYNNQNQPSTTTKSNVNTNKWKNMQK